MLLFPADSSLAFLPAAFQIPQQLQTAGAGPHFVMTNCTIMTLCPIFRDYKSFLETENPSALTVGDKGESGAWHLSCPMESYMLPLSSTIFSLIGSPTKCITGRCQAQI